MASFLSKRQFWIGTIDGTYLDVWNYELHKCKTYDEAYSKVVQYCSQACNIPMDEHYASEYRRQNGFQSPGFYVDYKNARNYNILYREENREFLLKLGGVEGKHGYKQYPSREWRYFADSEETTVYYRNFWVREELQESLTNYIKTLF